MDFYLNHMNNLKTDTKLNTMIKKLKDKNIFNGRNAINF